MEMSDLLWALGGFTVGLVLWAIWGSRASRRTNELEQERDRLQRKLRQANATIETRDALARHPWAPVLWLRTMPGPNRIDHMEFLLAAFAETGLPDELAHHGFHAVNNHVVGFTIQAQEMAVTTGDQSMEELARGFVESLDADALDASCLESLGGFPFFIDTLGPSP